MSRCTRHQSCNKPHSKSTFTPVWRLVTWSDYHVTFLCIAVDLETSTIKFHSFRNGQTVTPFFAFFSQHVIDQTVDSQHSWGLLSEWMIHELKIVGHFTSTDPENFKNATHPLRFLWNLVCLSDFVSWFQICQFFQHRPSRIEVMSV